MFKIFICYPVMLLLIQGKNRLWMQCDKSEMNLEWVLCMNDNSILSENNGCISIHCSVIAVVLSALSQNSGSLQQVLLLTGGRLNCFCKLSNSVIIKRHLTKLASSSQEGNCHKSRWNTQAVTIHYNKQASWTSH